MRITISDNEFGAIQEILYKHDKTLYERLNEELEKSMQSCTPKKKNATKKANMLKKQRSKEAVENAVNILRFEHKKITVYSVAKTARISYNTAKKYEEFILAQ